MHSAAASIVEGTFGIDGLHRRQDRDPHLVEPQRVRQIDRVLHDVDLPVEVGRDVDGGVGDDQRVLVTGHVHHEAMADAARRADAGVARHNSAHQLVGVQAALHQSLGRSLADQRDRLCGRVVAVLGGLDESNSRNVELRRPSRVTDAGRWADKDRLDQAKPGGFHSALERDAVTGMRDRRFHRRQASRGLEQAVVLVVRVGAASG